ncbi:hypothetical protein ABZ128_09355 [Streptomyces sp. NPDC006326]|uniref:hypothetical protein n=1 Tax=Streptomyces sp. NPDC006326 TaxID=3156752 RepID=UPI0033A4DC93
MSITAGSHVVGHIVNQGRRVEFTGTVTSIYPIGGLPAALVACDDGHERTALVDNVEEIKAAPKLTENMVRTLKNLVHHETVSAEGTRAMNAKGCTYPALKALVRRGLAEVVGGGKTLPRFGGGTYEPQVYRATAEGRRVQDLI